MPAVRVYVPLDRRGLLALVEERALRSGEGGPVVAYAVTPGLEAAHPGEGAEELEYLAFCDAAGAASRLRERSTDRRVVVSADADPDWLADSEGGTAAVSLTADLPRSRIASFHVDDPTALEAGDESADEMLWYDATELDEVSGFFR
jgi:hypothetical protein